MGSRCKNTPKIKVYKTKEYKIHHKKWEVVKKCTLCKQTFTSQKDLNVHTQDFHNYKFMCKHQKCGKIFSSESSLKKHELHHSKMKFKCNVCCRSFPFQSELNSHQAIHSVEKSLSVLTPDVKENTKPRRSIIDIIKLIGQALKNISAWFARKFSLRKNI